MATKDISDVQVVLAYLESRDSPERQAAARGGAAVSADLGDDYPWPEQILETRTGQCGKVCCRAMERAARRGFIEYGVSLRSGWPTDTGKALVAEACAEKGIAVPRELNA